MKKIIVSGIQPSGPLHIGNYLGALRYWKQLQDDPKNQCYFFIADLHALTQAPDPKELRKNIKMIVAELFALGINSRKSVLFVQSDVKQHTELGWIFNCVTPISELSRMTQFKDKSEQNKSNINNGLFSYPVLQAADILMYGGTHVPVGEDQIQHVELTRKIARSFNNRYGKTFPEARPILTPTPRVMSLTAPHKKMSKSHGEKNVINLNDSPKVIAEKIKKAKTESTGKIPVAWKGEWLLKAGADKNEGVAGAYNLLKLLEYFGTEKDNMRFTSGSISYKDLKQATAASIATYFASFRKKRAGLMKRDVLTKLATKKAQLVAKETMMKVGKKTGL